MKIVISLFLCCLCPLLMVGQKSDSIKETHFPRHYISINPLNIFLFQQAGITYEYKPGIMGYGITAGYIYPNKKEYSNYFIAGPTMAGSLGDYSGFFIVPQVNVFLTKPKHIKHAGLVYVTFKMVYKYMYIDSISPTAWHHHGNYYYTFRKMIDKVNIYGGFIDFGYRYVLYHFYFDLNFGLGAMWINHKMIISGERTDLHPYPMYYFHPVKEEELHELKGTINFTLNFGVAF